jgi:hypothetical protein
MVFQAFTGTINIQGNTVLWSKHSGNATAKHNFNGINTLGREFTIADNTTGSSSVNSIVIGQMVTTVVCSLELHNAATGISITNNTVQNATHLVLELSLCRDFELDQWNNKYYGNTHTMAPITVRVHLLNRKFCSCWYGKH